jgi:mannose-1-phosphate guanylyltransferase
MNLDNRTDETCLVMAADHLISPMSAFAKSVESASVEARRGFIVPYGIVPRNPATGYGYIETGAPAGEGFEVISFREKPDAETAAEYVSSGRYFWNAGLFTYRNDVFQSELAQCSPETESVFHSPRESWFETRTDDGILVYEPADVLRSLYAGCTGVSVDYAVMEKTTKIRMVEADFDWNDVGSWDVIAEINNPSDAPVYSYESRDNFVYSDRPVALCGVEDLIVVVANDRVMVCRKGMSQLVKNAAEDDLSEK